MVIVPLAGGGATVVEYALNTNMLINNGSNLICFGTNVFIKIIFLFELGCILIFYFSIGKKGFYNLAG